MTISISPIRFAIWAAVSTKEQAADEKASLRAQESECRQVASLKGWLEATGPYIVRGASRTRWANLHDAEIAVPELRAMLDAAQAHQFDILVVKDYDRFRDLLDQVYRTLNDYNVQFFSLAQPIEPVSPEKFDPYASDSQELLISFSQMRSRTEIRTTRRRYLVGMPDRIQQHGLPAVIPYGYSKPLGRETDRKAVPEPDDSITPFIIAAKDAFLSGQSTRQIVEMLQLHGAPTPGGRGIWHQATVRAMLRNSFYAGVVRWGCSKVHSDRRTGQRSRERNLEGQAITAPGKHIALWDETTYQAIMTEFKRRQYHYSGRRTGTLSGLLVCGQCGKTMWLNYLPEGHVTHHPDTIVWRCGSRQSGHPFIKNPVAMRKIIDEIKRALTDGIPVHSVQEQPDKSDQLLALYQRRKRIQDAYDDGLYDLKETRTRIMPLDEQIALLEALSQHHSNDARDQHERDELLTYLRGKLDMLENLFLGESLQDVNHVLKRLLSNVVIIDKETTSVNFR